MTSFNWYNIVIFIVSLFFFLFPALSHAANTCKYGQALVSSGVDTLEYDVPMCTTSAACCDKSSVDSMTMDAFNNYRKNFIMDAFYKCPVEQDLKSYVNEVQNVALAKLAMIGAFLDASILNNTLNDLQAETSKSLQSYTPSDQVCRFGTMVRSLAATDSKVDSNKRLLDEAALQRDLGKQFSAAASGGGQDIYTRLDIFHDKYCNLLDNASGLSKLCTSAPAISDINYNKDIDFVGVIDNPLSVDADLMNSNVTPTETAILKLSDFLYGHTQFNQRISDNSLVGSPPEQEKYHKWRSVSARRAVAQNTYNALVAMKMAGTGNSDDYLLSILYQLGLSAADSDKYLGGKSSTPTNASYNAQMNLLTKQIFQDPSFYANLMESKNNVKRISASLQGIGLMQGRDTYKSMTRSEMLMALLVELEARKVANNLIGERSK